MLQPYINILWAVVALLFLGLMFHVLMITAYIIQNMWPDALEALLMATIPTVGIAFLINKINEYRKW